jgi:hypothetical protein
MSFDIKRLCHRQFNVGTKDQQIRLGAGVAIMILASIMENGILMLLGLLVAVLAVLKWCPAYSALGKTTVEPGDKPPAI